MTLSVVSGHAVYSLIIVLIGHCDKLILLLVKLIPYISFLVTSPPPQVTPFQEGVSVWGVFVLHYHLIFFFFKHLKNFEGDIEIERHVFEI